MRIIVDYIPDDNLIRVSVEADDRVVQDYATIGEANMWAERFLGAAEQAEKNA